LEAAAAPMAREAPLDGAKPAGAASILLAEPFYRLKTRLFS